MTGTNGRKSFSGKIEGLEGMYALDIVDLSKRFRRQGSKRSGYTSLKSAILQMFSRKAAVDARRFTTAVKDLTLRIPRGASVGIIGRNGSGKSTLLKLITGIYKPDTGYVQVCGRAAALIELGAGFHPDFTGRENVYLAGVMYGLSRAQIDARFKTIVDFAELQEVIDDPVRTYSSGMFMRLGFSLAVHTDPDILMVDEVLAVGDASFVAKCKDRLAQMRSAGVTLLLVSHDLDAVERWCDEALWLDSGEVKDRGDPRRVIDAYRRFLECGEEELLLEEQPIIGGQAAAQEPELTAGAAASAYQRWGSREIEIIAVRLLGSDGQPGLVFRPEEAVTIEIDYCTHGASAAPVFGIGIIRNDGLVVHGTNTGIERITVPELSEQGTVRYSMRRIGLLDGSYRLDAAVHREDEYPYDYHKGILHFTIRGTMGQIGIFAPEHEWDFGC